MCIIPTTGNCQQYVVCTCVLTWLCFFFASSVPLITIATATGYNTTAIQLAVVFKYRGSSHPISLRVTYANVDTQSSQTVTYRNITLKDLEWRTVISGLDFNLFTFTVVALNDVGGSGAVTTQPTYPKPGTIYLSIWTSYFCIIYLSTYVCIPTYTYTYIQ